jgi:hypothetical protein
MSHKKYREEKNCLNCGAVVIDKFCHKCGQENLDTRENFFHLVGHFISDYFHFDSKFFRSLIPLFARPGFLTREYWEGRRVRYIHPLRLFFFVTIIFVISSNAFYKHYGEKLKGSIFVTDSTLAKIDNNYLSTLNDSAKVYMGKGRDSLAAKEVRRLKAREVRQLKKLAVGTDDVFKSLKYVTFFLLPVYALIFRLLYVRRKSFYVDHLVYAMHFQTFAYSFLSIILFLAVLFSMSFEMIRLVTFVFLLIYIAASLRYLYKQPWWKTILKSLISTFLIFFITLLGIVVLAFLDAMFLQSAIK